MFKRLDPRGPTVLGFNQLFLASAITLYAAWNIYRCLAHPKAILSELDMEALTQFGITEKTVALWAVIFYSAVIAATWITQGLTALYYFSRRKHLDAYITSTPQWIHDLQRAQQP